MNKPAWRIYLNNFFAFLIYSILSLFFRRKNISAENLLFINTGQLGDVIISSLIMENENLFKQNQKIYLLIKKQYADIFSDRLNRVEIIRWNYNKYKWNIFYRINFLSKLKKLRLKECYNMTSARGITCDELALLSSAENVYAANSNWKYLKKAFGKIMDKKYSKIFASETINEYEKHFRVIERITERKDITFNGSVHKIFLLKNNELKISEYIIIAPYSSIPKRAYPFERYMNIIKALSERIAVVILGTKEEGEQFNLAMQPSENIYNMAGKIELKNIPSVINHSKLFIGNDSGLTHLALKFDKKILAIIGGGCFNLYFPYRMNLSTKYFYHEMDCFGCEWNCIHEEMYCLTNVNPDLVIKNALKLLEA
jgi:heptosyltransferase I